MLLTPGVVDAAFTVTLDTTRPWETVRPNTIARQNVLKPSSSNVEVEQFLFAELVRRYGKAVTGGANAAQLTVSDVDRYMLSLDLPAGSKPIFEGDPVVDGPDVDWRLDWCALPGDAATIYHTVLSGTRKDPFALLVVPTGTWFPLPLTAAVAGRYAEEAQEAARAAAAAEAEAIAAPPNVKSKKAATLPPPPPPDPEEEARKAEEVLRSIVDAMRRAAGGGARPAGTICNVTKLKLRRTLSRSDASMSIQTVWRGLLARKATQVIRIINLRKGFAANPAALDKWAGTGGVGLRAAMAAKRLKYDRNAMRRSHESSELEGILPDAHDADERRLVGFTSAVNAKSAAKAISPIRLDRIEVAREEREAREDAMV